MAILQVNLGNYSNDGTGDDLRSAFTKYNETVGDLDLNRVISADNLGSGAPIFLQKFNKNLQLRSIKSGLNIYVTYDNNEITINTPDSINAVEEDPNPVLGGNLNVNNYNILGTGNIYLTGEVVATSFEGNLTGDVTGNVTGNLTGDVTGNLTGDVTGNLTGDVTGDVTGNLYGNVVGDIASSGLSTFDNISVSSGSINGTVIGNSSPNQITGTNITATLGFIGNLSGTVSSIANHDLEDLGNVSSTSPTTGQALVWSGSIWEPGTITAGVSRIIAGTNVSISPTNGLGEVTINATGISAGGDLDFGSFLSPAGFTLDLGSF